MSEALQSDIRSVAQRLVVEAQRAGVRIGCAESCTGGLVSGAITAVPGSSAVLRGGIVSYDPQVKHDVLGVAQEVIDEPSLGVVSDVCAAQMCLGASRVLDADVSVAVTGIAGPGGAEPGKPVGTVWFGLCVRDVARTLVRHFDGSRDEVRMQAVLTALTLICEGIEELAANSMQA